MLLYHASQSEIRTPKIDRGRKNADFGPGFYLTPDRDFARRWAGAGAFVNAYAFDPDGLDVRTFERDEAWFRCIFENRRGRDGAAADAVIGPIANDTIFETYGIISSGFLCETDAVRLLSVGPAYTQVALKTERAIQRLRWIGAERIETADASLIAEQAAYDEALGRVIEALDLP